MPMASAKRRQQRPIDVNESSIDERNLRTFRFYYFFWMLT